MMMSLVGMYAPHTARGRESRPTQQASRTSGRRRLLQARNGTNILNTSTPLLRVRCCAVSPCCIPSGRNSGRLLFGVGAYRFFRSTREILAPRHPRLVRHPYSLLCIVVEGGVAAEGGGCHAPPHSPKHTTRVQCPVAIVPTLAPQIVTLDVLFLSHSRDALIPPGRSGRVPPPLHFSLRSPYFLVCTITHPSTCAPHLY